jgi:hypothetical protein
VHVMSIIARSFIFLVNHIFVFVSVLWRRLLPLRQRSRCRQFQCGVSPSGSEPCI